ncbi:MAG: glycosyltransferase [Armatimonadota bacterium]
MRIIVVGPSFPFRGGIAHYTALLCKSLAESHEVQLVSMSRQYPRLLFPGKTQRDESAVKLVVEGAEPLVDSMNPLSWSHAAKRIREYSPELVIIQWWHPFFAPAFGSLAALCRKFTKVMFLCHNVLPHEKSGPVRLFTKYALGKGNMFITHSEEDTINLKDILPNAQVRKARHPTYEVFRKQPISKDTARRELGLSQNQNVILFFGLVREYKGLKYLIEAMPAILSSVNAVLVIAGEFYDGKEKYVRLIKDLGIDHCVKITDEYIPNEAVGMYFSAADLVVLPYVTATQSGIAQIAYGFDRPVVTTNVGGLPETVIDGKTGYVVSPEDSYALARAVVRFFEEDKAGEFIDNISAFREEFSWSRLVEAIESLVSEAGGTGC